MRNWWHVEQRDAKEPLHVWRGIDLLITDTPHVDTLSHDEIEYVLKQWVKLMHDTGTMIVCVSHPVHLDYNVLQFSHEDYAGPPGRKLWTEAHILEHSKPDDVVCDPFCGGSTTGQCAIHLGRNYIGTDIALGQIETSFEQLVKVTEQEE